MTAHYVVVGGTRGTGRALVDFLCRRRRRVSVLARGRPPGFPDQALFLKCDIRDAASASGQLRRGLKINGPVRYLILCQRHRDEGDAWEGEIGTALTASREIIEKLSGSFASDGDRAIVFIGSVAADFVVPPQGLSYHVAKAGLVQMMRYYAWLLGPRGIRVNCVTIGTLLKDEAMEHYARHPELADAKSRLSPLGRMGRPRDVVNAVDFLCSSQAAYITGHNLVVDGGMTLIGHESLAQAFVERNALLKDGG